MHDTLDFALTGFKAGTIVSYPGILHITCYFEFQSLILLLFIVSLEDKHVNFIIKWIDYSNKYGLGYQLRDGTVGVHFNDATSIVLAKNGK